MTTVGLLYPGHSAEDDYPRLEVLLGGDIRLPIVHTEIGEDAHRVDALLNMDSPQRLAATVEALRLEGAESVVWACTRGSFVLGWEGAHEQVRELAKAAGMPASSTSFGFVHAIRRLGTPKVAIAATYPADVTEHFAAFLEKGGAVVVSGRDAGIATAEEVATWGREEVLELARSADHPNADVLLVPDTALHTTAHLAELEQVLGKPVITANQVTVWEGLRLCDRRAWADGLGTLFARPE